MPPPLLRLFLFLVVLVFLIALIQFGVVTIAFEKLGLSSHSAYVLLITTLFGSMINLPLFSMGSSRHDQNTLPPEIQNAFRLHRRSFTGKTLVAVNVGGAVVPVAFSIYLLIHNPISLAQVLIAVAMVAAVAHWSSRPVRGIGIAMPILLAPVVAALAATWLNSEQRAELAYIGGTLGVLVGADLLRLKDIRSLGAPVASIGGAGSFDGIFIAGLLAVLLA
ncbi:MAG TPA: DUF1614 domain-containing protein [Burkholderiales bacterium]|nr:DUF1614 domain-containing protein [Burkholderiales bacterium]